MQYDITCCRKESLWRLKAALIERNHGHLQENGFNHGIFCFPYGYFLDEQLTFADYFPNLGHNSLSVVNSIQLEFLYKQRIKYGEVMSTLPIGRL